MALVLLPDLALPATTAMIFAPFVLPICAHVAWTDLSAMRISNKAVLALGAIFLLLGPFLYPLDTYGWRVVTLLAVLAAGVAANAAGLMGAGDAKFIAAASPLLEPADLQRLLVLFCAVLLAAFATHRLARVTPLRRLVPHWQSWKEKRKFPMGFPLGATLAGYLLLAIFA